MIQHTTLSNIAAVFRGYQVRKAIEQDSEGDVHFVQMRDISEEIGVEWDRVAQITLPPKKRPTFLEEKDILFVARGNRNIAVPVEAIKHPAVASEYFFIIRPDSQVILPDFLAWQINRPAPQEYIESTLTPGEQRVVKRDVVASIRIAVPALNTQNRFANLIRRSRNEAALYKKLIENRNAMIETLASHMLDDHDSE